MNIEIYVNPFEIEVPDGSDDDVNEWIENQLMDQTGGELCRQLLGYIG
jgi:hypothetical protein